MGTSFTAWRRAWASNPTGMTAKPRPSARREEIDLRFHEVHLAFGQPSDVLVCAAAPQAALGDVRPIGDLGQRYRYYRTIAVLAERREKGLA